MMYIKFSSKDTTAIINATDKLINCNPVKSVKVKSIPPELRELCRIVRGQLRVWDIWSIEWNTCDH